MTETTWPDVVTKVDASLTYVAEQLRDARLTDRPYAVAIQLDAADKLLDLRLIATKETRP